MALGTGHYLCERREVKRMGGGREGGRAGEVKSILEWIEPRGLFPITTISGSNQFYFRISYIEYLCLCRRDNS